MVHNPYLGTRLENLKYSEVLRGTVLVRTKSAKEKNFPDLVGYLGLFIFMLLQTVRWKTTQ